MESMGIFLDQMKHGNLYYLLMWLKIVEQKNGPTSDPLSTEWDSDVSAICSPFPISSPSSDEWGGESGRVMLGRLPMHHAIGPACWNISHDAPASIVALKVFAAIQSRAAHRLRGCAVTNDSFDSWIEECGTASLRPLPEDGEDEDCREGRKIDGEFDGILLRIGFEVPIDDLFACYLIPSVITLCSCMLPR